MPGKDQSWDESWQKKGNRGIVLTDVPRSQLDLPLHSVALAPRLSYPLIVGNLLSANDNTKHCQRHNGPEGLVHLAKVISQVQT